MLKLRRLIIVSTAALQLLLASGENNFAIVSYMPCVRVQVWINFRFQVLALEEDCTDFWGESVRHGEMYTPGEWAKILSGRLYYQFQLLLRSQRVFDMRLLSQWGDVLQSNLLQSIWLYGELIHHLIGLIWFYHEFQQFCTKFRVGEKCCEITCYDSDAEVEAARNKLKNRPRKFFGIPIRFSLSHAESSIAKSSIINAITIAMVALLVSQLT